ncbi:MAG: roadblock/LC7 domain-containing protein [Nocardioides sp.]
MIDDLAAARLRRPRSTELDPDIAEHWDLWSTQIGRALLPRLEATVAKLPGVTSAMICTSDGFNLCALGVDEDQAARLSAMVSSLYSISSAATSCLDLEGAGSGEGGEEPHQLSLHDGSHRTVVTAVPDLVVGRLLVWLSATEASLGLMIIEAKALAHDVHALLGDDD